VRQEEAAELAVPLRSRISEDGSETDIPPSFDDIVDHCCYASNSLINQPWKIMSIARRDWAAVGHSI
jgi:hypothetical protein